jgi:large subunit ribosomal protein L28|tara:strand:+ start:10125 stop:10364 length:240 start_codon:yes stop_codon:yes gene_type:complete
MSKFCAISGKRPLVGNNVSKSHIKTKRRQLPNLQLKSIYIPELERSVKIKVSVAALKTIDKIGLMRYLKKQDLQLSDIV